MNDDMMRAARVCCEINSPVCSVVFPGFMSSVLKVFKSTIIPSEISTISHYSKEYFEPAQKMHEVGNYSGAVEVYEKAVSAGSSLACFILSQYYLQGIGVERDISRFFSLLEKGGVIRDDHIDVYRSIVSNGFPLPFSPIFHNFYFHFSFIFLFTPPSPY